MHPGTLPVCEKVTALAQYEKIMSHGLRTIGNRIWQAHTTVNGKITAHASPVTRH